ncbi:hypothetical protein [Paraburkholderia sp. BCC1886]|uniref:hypothetical protein n=1 Tax=Paraburkholderia sp. BCC1886 TaxID=2562670 RepID=UPI001183C299|nr:hypothetical protein [Paraburkholderia sp. BCC1886]
MARPKIGLFGALMALGGFLAVRYVQRNRAQQIPVARELSRWEDEGGAVAAPATPAGSVTNAPAAGHNGAAYTNGNGGAWPFPRS